MNLPVYFDHASTTPLRTEVLEAMMPFLTMYFGNASSRHHAYGWLAEEAIQNAINQIKTSLKANDKQLIFTSGATEAINTVLFGFASKNPKGHIVSLKTEHKATLACLEKLKKNGYLITYLPVNSQGNFEINDLKDAIKLHNCPVLFSLVWVNNETGLIHPISEIAALKSAYTFEIHVDASQAVGKIPMDLNLLSLDYFTYSAHKIYGPKGVGGIIAKNRIEKLIHGGGQQAEQRGGTLNTAAIVGFAKATQLATEETEAFLAHTQELQGILENTLKKDAEKFYIHANNSLRVSNISSIAVKNTDSEMLIQQLAHKFAITNGSACNAASTLPSHVLKAMNFSDAEAYSTIRVSFGWSNSSKQVVEFVELLTNSPN